jgi:hypothetical protein
MQLVVDYSKKAAQAEAMKTLSVKQPYATLICAGIKRVENRTWTTDYRGRFLIHASGNHNSFYEYNAFPKKWMDVFSDYIDKYDNFDPPKGAPETIQAAFRLNRRIFEFYHQPLESDSDIKGWMKDAVKKYGYFFQAQAIIGEATLSCIIQNSDDDFAIAGQYHWLMSDPVLYDKPIAKVIGHLRLWDFKK